MVLNLPSKQLEHEGEKRARGFRRNYLFISQPAFEQQHGCVQFEQITIASAAVPPS